MVGQLNRCLLFVVNIGSEVETIKWYTIITLHAGAPKGPGNYQVSCVH